MGFVAFGGFENSPSLHLFFPAENQGRKMRVDCFVASLLKCRPFGTGRGLKDVNGIDRGSRQLYRNECIFFQVCPYSYLRLLKSNAH